MTYAVCMGKSVEEVPGASDSTRHFVFTSHSIKARQGRPLVKHRTIEELVAAIKRNREERRAAEVKRKGGD